MTGGEDEEHLGYVETGIVGDVAYTVCEATAKEILGVELARERGCGKLKV